MQKTTTTVLVVEDEGLLRKLLLETLTNWGYNVVAAADGEEAWEAFERDDPEIVITDLFMPCIDGFDLCRRIRKKKDRGYTYILVLTGHNNPTNMFDALFAGADEFLVKPWKAAELRARIQIGERLLSLESQLRQRIAGLEEANRIIVKANESLKQDLIAVAKIQTSLLPKVLPAVQGLQFAWEYHPHSELAGDALNAFRLDENNLAFYLLDVSGTGTPAALLSVSLNQLLSPVPAQSSLIKTLSDEAPGYKLRTPAVVLEQLNQRFPLDEDNPRFFTICYVMLNLETRQLRMASAGHPRPVLLRPGQQPLELSCQGQPIGFVDDAQFSETEIQLEPGDRLFLFSDGLTEARNHDGTQFYEGPMLAELMKTNEFDLKSGIGSLVSAVFNWCGEAGAHDDMSILGIQFLESAQEEISNHES